MWMSHTLHVKRAMVYTCKKADLEFYATYHQVKSQEITWNDISKFEKRPILCDACGKRPIVYDMISHLFHCIWHDITFIQYYPIHLILSYSFCIWHDITFIVISCHIQNEYDSIVISCHMSLYITFIHCISHSFIVYHIHSLYMTFISHSCNTIPFMQYYPIHSRQVAFDITRKLGISLNKKLENWEFH